MVQWRSVFIALGFVLLLFFAIPIRISNVEEVEERVLFEQFVKDYNKSYRDNETEYERRFQIFKNSLEQIKNLNVGDKSHSSPVYGITYFADIELKEFNDTFLNYEHKQHKHNNVSSRISSRYRHHHHRDHVNRLKRAIGGPMQVDWRLKGVVSDIKNQKTCGACWAFSTIETIESMHAIKTGTLLSLSTQEAIDCARNGNMGCDGGDTCNLLYWLVSNNIGVQEERDYPLVLQTQTCKLKPSTSGIHVASNYSCDYLVGEEDVLLSLLAFHGPVAVAVNAIPWQYYVKGVIQFNCDGSLENLNHAVQLVGYNLDATPPYYIARNSWGKAFGERGYLRIAIGSNVCGIASEVAALDVL